MTQTNEIRTREQWLSQFETEELPVFESRPGPGLNPPRIRLFETTGQNVSISYFPATEQIGELTVPQQYELNRRKEGDVFGPHSLYPITWDVVEALTKYIQNPQTIFDRNKTITNYNLIVRSEGQRVFMRDLSTALRKRFPSVELDSFLG